MKNEDIRNLIANPLPSALSDLFFLRLKGKIPAVFLDYDGTLTPIVSRPEDAVLSEDMREIVARCSSKFITAIVSGRDIEDVKMKTGIKNLIIAGSHGFRISIPGKPVMENEESVRLLPDLDRIEEMLKSGITAGSGAQIDRKKFAIAVHYRNVADNSVSGVIKKTYEVFSLFKGFKMLEGKKVLEVRPDVNWHKGKAIEWILYKMDIQGKVNVVPIFIGDDITDEDAFNTIAGTGVGIIVGFHDRPTAASFVLKNTYEVGILLNKLSDYTENNE